MDEKMNARNKEMGEKMVARMEQMDVRNIEIDQKMDARSEQMNTKKKQTRKQAQELSFGNTNAK